MPFDEIASEVDVKGKGAGMRSILGGYWYIRNHIHRFKLAVLGALWIFGRPFYQNWGIEEVSQSAAKTPCSKIAIIAAYPNADPLYLRTMSNLLNGFREEKIQVLFVSNRLIPSDLQEILDSQGCWSIVRRNRGRDFGAYQAGVMWLEKCLGLGSFERLFLVNDTLLWGESSRTIVSQTSLGAWSCMFLNLAVHSHAQSFFMSFSNEVLRSKRFQTFWRKYPPLNSRVHAILRGEEQLSSLLVQQGFRCTPYVDYFRVISKSKDLLPYEAHEILSRIPISKHEGRGVPGVEGGEIDLREVIKEQEKSVFANAQKSIRNSHDIISQQKVQHAMAAYCHFQAPHRIGLHLHVMLGVPIKADLYKIYPLATIVECLSLRNAEFAQQVHDYMLNRSQILMEGSRHTYVKRRLSEI